MVEGLIRVMEEFNGCFQWLVDIIYQGYQVNPWEVELQIEEVRLVMAKLGRMVVLRGFV